MRLKGPLPVMSLIEMNLPGGLNSKDVPRASMFARLKKAPGSGKELYCCLFFYLMTHLKFN